MIEDKEVLVFPKKDLGLIKHSDRELVLIEVAKWQKSRALARERQEQARKEKKEKTRRLQKQRKQELYKRFYAKLFVQFAKRHLRATDKRLAEMNEKQLRIVDDVVARRILTRAIVQTASLTLGPVGILTGAGMFLFAMTLPVGWIWIQGLLATLGIAAASVSFIVGSGVVPVKVFTYDEQDSDSKSFSSRKYLFGCRYYLKKIFGKDYFPYREVQKLLK